MSTLTVDDLFLGKLDATTPHFVDDIELYVQGKIPTPAPSADYYSGVLLPMFGNDRFGCCVAAGVGHHIGAWDKEVGQHDTVPTEKVLVAEYFKLTGGQDSGLNENDTLHTWATDGLFGHKLAAYGPVKIKDIVSLHQAIYFWGGSMFGIQCPQSAQQQFLAGKPWTVVPGSPIEGGHCIVALGYDAEYVYCATWGGIAAVSYPFLSAYLDEAWAAVSNQFVEANKGPTLDLASLRKDLAIV